MKCPKCRNQIDEVQCEDVTIDRCVSCQGMWFDKGEAEALSKDWIAEYVDTGDPEVGEAMDEIDTIYCPRCDKEMNRFFDVEATGLAFEHGKFFDAGEFTLWAENQYL